MKTLTEFVAPTLKNASKVKAELTTAGKSAEELPAALGEALKLEGDKLKYLLNAVDYCQEALGGRLDDLKRVLVLQAAENEKAPEKAVAKDGFHFLAEFYPPLHKPSDKNHGPRDGGRGPRGDKGRGKGRGKGRDARRRRPDAQGQRPAGPTKA